VRAALYPKREVYVGWGAVQAVVGTMFFPGLLDRLLSRMAWKGQLSSEPVDLARRKDNLHAALPGDFGAHGRFDRKAKRRSLVTRTGANPRTLAYVGSGAIALLSLALYKRRNRHSSV